MRNNCELAKEIDKYVALCDAQNEEMQKLRQQVEDQTENSAKIVQLKASIGELKQMQNLQKLSQSERNSQAERLLNQARLQKDLLTKSLNRYKNSAEQYEKEKQNMQVEISRLSVQLKVSQSTELLATTTLQQV